jgi:ribosomal protein S16
MAGNKRGRDSKTGRFITVDDAKKRPDTTTIDTIGTKEPKQTKKK